MIKDLESYRHGFIAGLNIKENYKTMIFGMELNEILDILEQHLKDKLKMTNKPKHIMTRSEAIACFKEHMPLVRIGADKVIDFYIAAGMLEVKEDNKKDKLYKKLKEYIPQEVIDQIWQEINEINS